MNREQFVAAVGGEQHKLRQFLLTLCCGNREEADDIAQDALVKAYLSHTAYKETGKFVPWLYKIAYNTFLDSTRNRRDLQPLEACAGVADGGAGADSAFRYQTLYSALAKLPPKERSAILLYYMKGYSVREIAGIEDCSEDAVKKQMSRGREQLKKILQDETGIYRFEGTIC